MTADINRRKFLMSVSMLAGGSVLGLAKPSFGINRKLKVAMVGTGIRGIGFWGQRLVDEFSDILEYVGLCDINPGRLEYALEYMKVNCNTYSNFEKMIRESRPDLIIVTTKDSTHHEFIIKGLEMGCDVLTEKPLTTDEDKCQAIIDAEKKSNKNLIVGFNYRWSPYMTKIKELLMNGAVGKLTSVDFHWYLNNYHGASYFRRWHGQKDSGGTLLVHKATHHFDLLNWWVNSDPKEVFAYGALEHYGSNGPFRGVNCRNCEHKADCKYHWDITKDEHQTKLYTNNEHYDGYVRDSCLFRHEIDIYDKMSAQVHYANNVVANYSLTTYSPFEGWRIAFNGTEGRLEAWEDIPYYDDKELSQAELHDKEMNQTNTDLEHKSLILHKNWNDFERIVVSSERSGHGGGDKRLHDKIFRNPDNPDPFGHSAGIRDGAMSVLIGIAARKSIEEGQSIKIEDLTELMPNVTRL